MHRYITMATAICLAGISASAPARAAEWRETVLHAFRGGAADGKYPLSSLTAAPNGRYYTVTLAGGINESGTVVELTPPGETGAAWAERVIHVFGAARDGVAPFATVVADRSGALFGTTYGGGRAQSGVIYRLLPPDVPGGQWRETLLHEFSGATDGGNPAGVLIQDASGALYGTTENGTDEQGHPIAVAFKLSPPAPGATRSTAPWHFTVLHRFTGPDGAALVSGLTRGRRGELYGVASAGGRANVGVVYRLDPPARGSSSWTDTTLFSFAGPDGNQPEAELTVDAAGVLYGTTQYGGARNQGTVFRLSPPARPGEPWREEVLLSFCDAIGTQSRGSLLLLPPGDDGRQILVGNTSSGGPRRPEPAGTVFALTAPSRPGGAWTPTILRSFTGGTGHLGGGYLLGGLLRDAQGALYGTAYDGDVAGDGTVWKLTP